MRRMTPLLAVLAVTAAPAAASASYSNAEKVAWIRRAAGNFVGAELRGDGAGACSVLNGPLRATEHGRTCEQRWDAKIARALRTPGERARLRADSRAIATAHVSVHGNLATISLPHPLMAGQSHLVWNEMCWMVEG